MEDEKNVIKMGLQMNLRVWSNFRWELAAAILVSFFSVVFNQFYIPIAIRHGATNIQVGLLTAAPAIGLILAPFWASIVEKSKPLRFVIYPNVVARFLILLPVYYPKPWVFIATAVVVYQLIGIQSPAYAVLVTRIYPAELRGRLMGNVRVASGLMMIPLAYLIGRWIDRSGGMDLLLIASLSGVVSVLLFINFKEIEPKTDNPSMKRRATMRDQFKLVQENKALVFFLVVTTLAGFGNLLAAPLYQIIQVGNLQLTNEEIGYVRVAYYLFLLFAYLIIGWVIDRYSPQRAMIIGMGAYATVPLLYAIFGNYPAVILAGGMQGMGDAIWDIGCLAFVFKLAPGREAVVFGLHLLLVGIRGTVAPLLSTSLALSMSFHSILYIAAVCIFFGFFLMAFYSRKSKNSERPKKFDRTGKVEGPLKSTNISSNGDL